MESEIEYVRPGTGRGPHHSSGRGSGSEPENLNSEASRLSPRLTGGHGQAQLGNLKL